MELTEVRPRLLAFRVLRYTGQTPALPLNTPNSRLRVDQNIELSLQPPDTQAGAAAPDKASAGAIVRITINASFVAQPHVTHEDAFSGTYEARFIYSSTPSASDLQALFSQEQHQYLLSAQAFPLAMAHFQRQLHAFGLSVRELPLGI